MNTFKNYIKRETKPDLYYKTTYDEEEYDNLSDYVDCSRNYKRRILIRYIPLLYKERYLFTLLDYVTYIRDHCDLYKSIDDNKTNNLYWYVRANELMRMYNAM